MNESMPLCSNCLRRPCQILDICNAAFEDEMDPDLFVLKYRNDFKLDKDNRFLCTDCKENLNGK